MDPAHELALYYDTSGTALLFVSCCMSGVVLGVYGGYLMDVAVSPTQEKSLPYTGFRWEKVSKLI